MDGGLAIRSVGPFSFLMRRSSLIGHVIELLDAVRMLKHPADQVVRDFFRTRHYLGAKDRRFISDMLFGIVRNVRFLEETVLAGTPYAGSMKRIPAILFVVTYELKFSGTSPDVLLPDVAGLWRVYLPDVQCEETLTGIAAADLSPMLASNAVRRLAVLHSFPDEIVREWIERFGEPETEALCKSLNTQAPITVRVNTLKNSVEECRKKLIGDGVDSYTTRLSPHGLVLAKRINAQALAAFKGGSFEMQDEGSQIISFLTQAEPGMTVVDACAGGGGKTLHLAALMQNQGRLIAIDVEERRLNNIRERVARAGVRVDEILLAGRDSAAIASLRGQADIVLVDAPCTGVGTFRRNPGAKLTFTGDFVARICSTQRAVLKEFSGLVKPGGRLVYSTCTLLRKENEGIVEAFLKENADFVLESASELLAQRGITVSNATPYLWLLPHKTTTDGFFAAAMARSVH